MRSVLAIRGVWALSVGVVLWAGCKAPGQDCDGTERCKVGRQTLYVAHEGALVSYDVETGVELEGVVENVVTPGSLMALPDGTLLSSLTALNEVLAVDGRSMRVRERLPSSGTGGVRPVGLVRSPFQGQEQDVVVLNDGAPGGPPSTSSVRWLNVSSGSGRSLQFETEVSLGLGHHEAAFAGTRNRLVISQETDCSKVLSVFDDSRINPVEAVGTLTAEQAGWTEPDPLVGFAPRFCDPTLTRGTLPAPAGCISASISQNVYCSLASSGEWVVVNANAAPPTFEVKPTAGAGGGAWAAHPQGRYLFLLQSQPREGQGGVSCQIGQVAVIDALTETLVAQVPLRYRGPQCTDMLVGTQMESAFPGAGFFSPDGTTLFIALSGGRGDVDARVGALLVLNTRSADAPVQENSLQIGLHTGPASGAVSGDGKWLFVISAVDATVAQVDVASRTTARTLAVRQSPRRLATWGKDEGPSGP